MSSILITFVYLMVNYVVEMADTMLAVTFSSENDGEMKIVIKI